MICLLIMWWCIAKEHCFSYSLFMFCLRYRSTEYNAFLVTCYNVNTFVYFIVVPFHIYIDRYIDI